MTPINTSQQIISYTSGGEDTEEERNSNEGEDGDSGDDTKVASKHGTLITGNGKVDCSSDSNDDRSDGSNNSRKGDEPDVYLIRPKRTSSPAYAPGRSTEQSRRSPQE